MLNLVNINNIKILFASEQLKQWNELNLQKLFYNQKCDAVHAFFYKQNFYKQSQAEVGKNSSKY